MVAVSVGLLGWWALKPFQPPGPPPLPPAAFPPPGFSHLFTLPSPFLSRFKPPRAATGPASYMPRRRPLSHRRSPGQHPLREPLMWCFCAGSFLFIVIKAPDMKLSIFAISKCPLGCVRHIPVVCSLSRTFRSSRPAPHPPGPVSSLSELFNDFSLPLGQSPNS